MKEAQIRLWCYRKVVHKRFCDSIALFVRLQFPRRLNDHLETAIYKSLLAPDEDAAGKWKRSLPEMMAETADLAGKRQRLMVTIEKLTEALGVMVELKRR